MATVLPIPSGPTNREIIDRAYRSLGLKDSMFARTAEEYQEGVEVLASMMLESPFDQLGYVQFSGGEGNRVEEESGIDRKWLEAVALSLAERLAPMIGKTLSPHTLKAKVRAYSQLCASVVAVPEAVHRPGTPRGAGARYRTSLGYGPFFPDYSKDDEEEVETDSSDDSFQSLPPV